MLHNATAWQEARYLPVSKRDKQLDFFTIQQKLYNKNHKVRISKEFWISLLGLFFTVFLFIIVLLVFLCNIIFQ